MIYYYIYKITCTKGSFKDKFYYGQHTTTNLNDEYKGSGKKLCDYYKTYPDDYIKEIICFCKDNEELNQKEYEIIHPWLNNPMCLNLMEGGHGGKLSIESKMKISNSNKEKLKGNTNHRGDKLSDEVKKKISDKTKEAMKHVTLWNKGKKNVYSEETLKSISNSLKGNQNHKGHKHSDEAKRKMSEKKKGSIAWNKGKKKIWNETNQKYDWISI